MKVKRKVIEVRPREVFLELPELFVNHRVEATVRTLDEEHLPAATIVGPHPALAGQHPALGGVVSLGVGTFTDWQALIISA